MSRTGSVGLTAKCELLIVVFMHILMDMQSYFEIVMGQNYYIKIYKKLYFQLFCCLYTFIGHIN